MTDYPFPKASIQHRLGQFFLEIGLFVVTLGIGYAFWYFIVLGQGQTPGKQILKLRVYDSTTGKPVKWGHMFIREVALFSALALFAYGIPIVFGLTTLDKFVSESSYSLGIGDFIYYGIFLIDAFWIFRLNNRRRLVDVICKTDVLNEAAMPLQTKGTLNISS
jgi:uncharacterized RDD family membrane protein YckC